ncbi:MAG: hypothetical protein QW520_02995 [Methanomassiliicoccales archaeon]
MTHKANGMNSPDVSAEDGAAIAPIKLILQHSSGTAFHWKVSPVQMTKTCKLRTPEASW